MTQHGYLFLADISGYTSYLAGVELEHAHEILTDLLEIITHKIKPVLTISKYEGDAVFAYTPEAKLPRGETLLELVEATYAAFCDRREAAHRRTTCTCAACRAIPTLDLKFFIHHGDYIIQTIGESRELVSADVTLAHRLMKNHVAEATGWHAYALFTARALEHLAVRPEGLHPQVETYEHLGDVQTHSLDLKARYADMVAARRVFITAAESDYVLIQDFAAPPPVVWEWLTEVQCRNQWLKDQHVVWSAAMRPQGRTGPGARNHCAHGKQVSEETFVDWRPFDYFTMETRGGGNPTTVETMQLELLPDGTTRLHDHLKAEMPLPTPLRKLMIKAMMDGMMKYPAMINNAARLLKEELARREAQQ